MISKELVETERLISNPTPENTKNSGSIRDYAGLPAANFLAEYQVSPESALTDYFGKVYNLKDGVGNTTIIEGFKSLPESLNHKTSIEERNEMFRAAYRAESGEEIQPKRRSFQWLASRFEGATIALHDVNVEAYDNFAEYARRPEEQLVIIGVLKKMAAGTVASWAYQETRKIKGEEKKMGKEAADEALNAFNYLTGLELSLLAKLEEKGTDVNSNYKREVDEILRRIPLGVATASVVLTLMLTSCGTNPGPNQTDIDSRQNQPQVSEVVGLPTPGIGITPGGVETISSPSPTPTVVENGNFGLLTQSSEWPGTGINVSELAKRLHENGELKPAKHIEEDSPEWVDIESQGGNIEGLKNAIVKKLRDQGITKYSLNVVQNTGWAIEVRDESGNILWSQSVDENGNVVLNEHPNRITEDSQFGKLDAESFDLKEGEVVEFDVRDGTVIGIVVNQEGDVVGNVNTTKKTIDRFDSKLNVKKEKVEYDAIKIAEELGITLEELVPDDIKRSFNYEGNYIVETLKENDFEIKFKIAKWNSELNIWEKTDLQEKYSYLLEIFKNNNFINSSANIIGDGYYSPKDESRRSKILHPIWTGKYIISEWEDPNRGNVDVIAAKMLIIDLQGRAIELNFRIGAKQFYRARGISVAERLSSNSILYEALKTTPEDLLKHFNLGEQMEIYITYQSPGTIPSGKCREEDIDWCNNEYYSNYTMHNENKDVLKKLVDSLNNGEEIKLPSSFIIPTIHVWQLNR